MPALRETLAVLKRRKVTCKLRVEGREATMEAVVVLGVPLTAKLTSGEEVITGLDAISKEVDGVISIERLNPEHVLESMLGEQIASEVPVDWVNLDAVVSELSKRAESWVFKCDGEYYFYLRTPVFVQPVAVYRFSIREQSATLYPDVNLSGCMLSVWSIRGDVKAEVIAPAPAGPGFAVRV